MNIIQGQANHATIRQEVLLEDEIFPFYSYEF